MASKEDYARAAAAVKAGTADKNQQALNAKAARNTGPMGSTARDAYKK